MSQQDVAIVRRAYDAYLREDVEAFIELHDPECTCLPRIARVEGGEPYRGHEGIRAYWRDVQEQFEDWKPRPAEIRDLGDALIVRILVSGRARDSGVTFDDLEFWQAITVADGLITWWEIHESEAEAHEALPGNLGRALQAYDAFNRRDLDAFLALSHEDIVNDSRIAAIEGGYYGHEGTRRWWNDFLQALPDYTIELIGLREVGDTTIGQVRALAHGAGSSAPLVDTIWHVLRWRDGKVIWWRPFPSEAEAVEAAQSGGVRR